ncbi:NUDIX hydrolase [Abyssalbus ytuae]|uniref:CoA pyrophosphatase n=1 Tax=Abyssalbus ytuae TaxID=2926907 RepID=A0A9E6ZZI7_9FLAO|nr:CoA pyrophosphatase [Abyssalbus ytuae]UOB18037.1 CoA pyrophosphatase [Abyssalbus ytuae]
MNFEIFNTLVSKITNLPLPGQEAHNKMSPLIRIRELEKTDIHSRNPRKAAVASLFYPDKSNNTRLLLILRKTYKGVHSNQVGFPGGKKEKEDSGLLYTALRETHEEVGIIPEKISVLKPLTEVYIPPSNFIVKPFLGLIHEIPQFIPQPTEVELIIEVMLSEFLDEKSVMYKKINTSYAQQIEIPVFMLNGHMVWGATAMILSEVKELLKIAL